MIEDARRLEKRKEKVLRNKPGGVKVEEFLKRLSEMQKGYEPLYTREDIHKIMKSFNPEVPPHSVNCMLEYIKELSRLNGHGNGIKVEIETNYLWNVIERYCRRCPGEQRLSCYRKGECTLNILPKSVVELYKEKMPCAEGRKTRVYNIRVTM